MKKIILFSFISFINKGVFAQSNLCFTSVQSTSFSANAIAGSFAKADFNNDGVQDICCESYYGVSLLLSNGTGSFSSLTTFSLGQMTQVVTTNDFNNDGNADIAAINLDSNKVFIVLGTGTGTIQSIITISTTTNPKAITTSDFNNDGKIDLAIANYMANNVSIYLGNGNGNFIFSNNYPVATNPTIIVAGDLNNDGFTDLFVVSNGFTRILKGNGAGLFAVANYINVPAYELITKDINSDGKLDLIYTNLGGATINIMTGNGNYTFNSTVSYSLNSGYYTASGLYVDDLNNDSKMDIACSSAFTNSFLIPCNIDVFLGQASGIFSVPTSFSISSDVFFNPSGFIPVDINGDNKLDLIGCTDNNPSFKILYNCNALGLMENFNNKNEFSLYPNPTSDILNINFDLEAELKKVEIFNDLGQLIRQEEIEFKNNRSIINTKELSNGIYHLNFQTADYDIFGKVSKRFVIAR